MVAAMALNSCLPTAAFMLAFLLLFNQGDPSSAGRPGSFWVAADKAQCSTYSNGSDCDTLAGYQGRKDVNFSLPDTTWIFLHGEHAVRGRRLKIVGARNVTLKGDGACAKGTKECVLVPKHHSRNPEILVGESSNVIFEQLKFQTNFRVCMTQTSNFCVNSVEFQNTGLVIVNPVGDYTIMESCFSPSHVYTEFSACPYTSEVSCNFTFTVKQCRMEIEAYDLHIGFVMTVYEQHLYHSIRSSITNSTFSYSNLTVELIEYPLCSFTMEVKNVSFYKASVNLEMPLIEKTTYPEVADDWFGAHVHINDCEFMAAHFGAVVIRLQPSWSNDKLGRVTPQHPDISISHLNFKGGNVAHHFAPYALRAEITDNMYHLHEAMHRILLTIVHNTFESSSQLAALVLKNLQGYRVLLAEGNQIVSNKGFGLLLNNTQVEFQGYNEISTNKFTRGQMGGGIYLSSDSQLLLKPHSLLNVSANSGVPYGGGLYNDYKGRRVNTLNEFVDCYVDKLTCLGWCFFQFISSDGQYVNASDIAEHNATVILYYQTTQQPLVGTMSSMVTFRTALYKLLMVLYQPAESLSSTSSTSILPWMMI